MFQRNFNFNVNAKKRIISIVCFFMMLILGIYIDTRYQYQALCVLRQKLSVLSQQYQASQLLLYRASFYQQQWVNQQKNLPSQTTVKKYLQWFLQRVKNAGLQINTVWIKKPDQPYCGYQKIPIKLILTGHYAQFLYFLRTLNMDYVMLNDFMLADTDNHRLSIKISFFLYTKAGKICAF